ncbi:MAG: peptidase, partial [Aquimonas sp.]
MTYCLGMNLDAGLVLVSDSRTNAGVDNVGRFEKMRVFAREGDRVVVTLSAGNLSVTQNVLSLMEQRARSGGEHSLWAA